MPVSHEPLARKLMDAIPGLEEQVPHPCDCPGAWSHRSAIRSVIMHLNDDHHPTESSSLDMWSRERIADWVETLPFDLTIDPELAAAAKQRDYEPVISAEQLDAFIASAKKATQVLEAWGKTVTLFFKEVNPETYEMVTGLKYPGKDSKEES